MSQNYLMRYPLITGQGSLGTQEDNDMISSPRYTEAKPSEFADLMMQDFKKNTVPLKETYNGEYMEPVVLPSLFPNAICNGRQAIGISMSSNTLPHNLSEVCDALVRYLHQNRNITLDEIMEEIKGPDFPLPNTIINSKDIEEAFRTGKSKVSLKVRGEYEIKGNQIIFTTIPYRTYRNKIREQISKNIDELDEIISDFNDESSVGQNRLIFTVKRGVSPETVVERLFELTDLQSTVSYNMNFIVNGTPKLCSMEDLIKGYIEHQENVLLNATNYDKSKVEKRIHILNGLIKAVDQIDKVIDLIKQSKNKNEALLKLEEFLIIDEEQASAILDMKLGRLTKIDKEELVKELEEKEKILKHLNRIIEDYDYRNLELIDKIMTLKEKYGDARRTKLLNLEIPKNKKEKPVFEPKDCVVIIKSNNTIKRVDSKAFKTQRRNQVGVKTKGSIPIFSKSATTADTLIVFTSTGRAHRLLIDNVPTSDISMFNVFKFDPEEIPVAYTILTNKPYVLFATKNGIVKKMAMEELCSKNKKGEAKVITLKANDNVVGATFVKDEQFLLITKNGYCIRIDSTTLTPYGRTAQGVKGINLREGDSVMTILPITNNDDFLFTVTEKGTGKRINLSEFSVQGRGGIGVYCSKEPLGGAIITSNNNILINGDQSSIVVSATDFPLTARTSTGCIMIKNNSQIVSVFDIKN